VFGPYGAVDILTLAVFFIEVAGDHFTTGYITSSPEGGNELSPLYRLLKTRVSIHDFINLSSCIKAVLGLFIFAFSPSIMIFPTLLVCSAPTFNMFWLWRAERNPAGPSR